MNTYALIHRSEGVDVITVVTAKSATNILSQYGKKIIQDPKITLNGSEMTLRGKEVEVRNLAGKRNTPELRRCYKTENVPLALLWFTDRTYFLNLPVLAEWGPCCFVESREPHKSFKMVSSKFSIRGEDVEGVYTNTQAA